jgi:hypothetical protein
MPGPRRRRSRAPSTTEAKSRAQALRPHCFHPPLSSACADYLDATGTLQGLGLVLGGICCKMLLAGSWRGVSTVKDQDTTKARDAAAADTRAALASKPIFTRHTPPFRAAAAAFAVALVSTQLF